MESFFLAETTKYLYLLFDSDNFIHNQGQHGTVINTPDGECVIYAGGYIFNTEAHPVDPAALHCCYNVPKEKMFDFSNLKDMRDKLRGENLQARNNFNRKTAEEVILNETLMPETAVNSSVDNSMQEGYEEDTDNNTEAEKFDAESPSSVSVNQITTESTMKLDDNDSFNLKFNDIKNYSVFYHEKINQSSNKFVPQLMLEKIREKNSRFPKNKTWESNYKLLSCKAQPFIQKLSIFGEFFNK